MIPMANYAFLNYIDQSTAALIPLMYSTPIPYGGLGLTPYNIGLALGIWSFFNGFVQIMAFAPLRALIGQKALYMTGVSAYLTAILMFPAMRIMAQHYGHVNILVWIALALQLTCFTFSYMSFGEPRRFQSASLI